MDRRYGLYKFILVMSIFLIICLKNYPIVDAATYNYNNTDNSIMLIIPLPFNSHIADQTINAKKYTGDLIPFP
jgi:hypothetical protein